MSRPTLSVVGGRYELGARLGAGGSATIYRAFDRTLERDVAIKVLRADLVDDPDLAARFRREARHAAVLSHPHVVRVFDADVDEQPYIVMELIDGSSLDEALRQRGRLTPGQTLTVVDPVARALAAAHRAGVIHRDVKPANILLDRGGRAKVADFGIARVLAATSHTRTGSFMGSVHYVAPEVVQGEPATSASDEYALGVVLFEALTGMRPFEAETWSAIAVRHTRDRVPKPSAAAPDAGIPRAVDAVVRRATDPNPGKRYGDLDRLADALRAAVPDGPEPVSLESGSHTLVIDHQAQHTDVVRPPGRDAVAGSGRGLGVALAPAAGLAASDVFLDDPRGAEADGDGAPETTLVRDPAGDDGTVAPVATGGDGDGTDDAAASDDGDVATSPDGSALVAARDVATLVPRTRTPLRVGRWLRRRTVVVVLVLLAFTGTAGATWNWVIAPVRTLPDVVGATEGAARAELDELGLQVEVQRQHDLEVPAGEVMDQQPDAGQQARAGDVVGLVVSDGLDVTTVPDLRGMTVDEATAAVADATLGELTTTEAYDDEIPAGQIVSSVPAAGDEVDQLTDLRAVVSLGVEQIEVPDVVGMELDEAEAELTDAGFAVTTTSAYSDDEPDEGDIVSQSAEAGTEIDKGSTVELVVSRGPVTIEVPDVRGDKLEDARAALQEAGLVVDVVRESRPNLGPFKRGRVGRAEELLPSPGTEVQRGDEVTIYTYVD